MRTRASCIASEQDVVVLPTPPFPPTNIHRSDFWLMIDSSVGARSSASASTAADILGAYYWVVVAGGSFLVAVYRIEWTRVLVSDADYKDTRFVFDKYANERC